MSQVQHHPHLQEVAPHSPHHKTGTAKHLPFWSCFGGSFTAQHVAARPKSAPASKADLRSIATVSDESWRIGSQVPEPTHIQPITAELPFSNSVTPRSAVSSQQKSALHQVNMNDVASYSVALCCITGSLAEQTLIRHFATMHRLACADGAELMLLS